MYWKDNFFFFMCNGFQMQRCIILVVLPTVCVQLHQETSTATAETVSMAATEVMVQDTCIPWKVKEEFDVKASDL